MNQLDFMHKQLGQVFQYAEMIVRLNAVQELLDVEGGYAGEKDLYQSIEELKIQIRKNLQMHLENSGVSDRARILVNNTMVLRSSGISL